MLRTLVASFIFVFTLTLSVPTARADELTDLANRMNAVIAEMLSLQKELQSLLEDGGASSGSATVLGASNSRVTLDGDLSAGATSDDIERVQRLLATDADIYPDGIVSGFYGPKTTDAIRNLQERFGLDTVGVIGPATKELLEDFMSAYPDENYPAGVLDKRPTVLGATTSNPPIVTPVAAPVVNDDEEEDEDDEEDVRSSDDDNEIKEFYVRFINGFARVDVDFESGSDKRLLLKIEDEDEDELIEELADRYDMSESDVEDITEFYTEEDEDEDDDEKSEDADEDEAEDAIEEAEDAIKDAEDEIEEADDDGDDVDYAEDTLDEAEDTLDDAKDALDDGDYDDAVDLAKDAEELAKDAEDRIGEDEDDSDEIDSIEVEVTGENEAEVEVEYKNGDDESFDVEEDEKDEIIEEIADELNVDEDEVEDVIDFDYGPIDEIEVDIEDDEARIIVEFESGVEVKYVINETDEDDIIEELADEWDEDEDDIEDVVDFN